MDPIEEFAPAKINLTLHVTGRRPDGYHLLDSLVVFADVGDRVFAVPAESTTLKVIGPRATGVPTGAGNLMWRAAEAAGMPAALTLEKNLPAASGIGGGSADAAATLRALSRLGAKMPDARDLLALGADVPVCIAGRVTRMLGVGEALSDVPEFPALPAVLVNPGVEVATPAVFRALTCRENPPMADVPAGAATPTAVADWLSTQRNDLEAPARSIAPVIGEVLQSLMDREGCLLARMSGSGATCFGLYPTPSAARAAAAALSDDHQDWWVVATTLS